MLSVLDDPELARENGADALITKPLDAKKAAECAALKPCTAPATIECRKLQSAERLVIGD